MLSDQRCKFYSDEQPIFYQQRHTDNVQIVLVGPMSLNGNCSSPIDHQSVFEILLIYRWQEQRQHEIRREQSITQRREGKPKSEMNEFLSRMYFTPLLLT